jgi:hypothetical protein
MKMDVPRLKETALSYVGRGENDAIVTVVKTRSLLHHSQPDKDHSIFQRQEGGRVSIQHRPRLEGKHR